MSECEGWMGGLGLEEEERPKVPMERILFGFLFEAAGRGMSRGGLNGTGAREAVFGEGEREKEDEEEEEAVVVEEGVERP